jgi:hypothetical protein
MEYICVTLEICTLYQGVPHGISIIKYTDSEGKWQSFHGLGIFNRGVLHNSPFIRINGFGSVLSISKMQNGRPADGSYCT